MNKKERNKIYKDVLKNGNLNRFLCNLLGEAALITSLNFYSNVYQTFIELQKYMNKQFIIIKYNKLYNKGEEGPAKWREKVLKEIIKATNPVKKEIKNG